MTTDLRIARLKRYVRPTDKENYFRLTCDGSTTDFLKDASDADLEHIIHEVMEKNSLDLALRIIFPNEKNWVAIYSPSVCNPLLENWETTVHLFNYPTEEFTQFLAKNYLQEYGLLFGYSPAVIDTVCHDSQDRNMFLAAQRMCSKRDFFTIPQHAEYYMSIFGNDPDIPAKLLTHDMNATRRNISRELYINNERYVISIMYA